MLSKIAALEKALRMVGAKKEADRLLKLAVPMIDAVSIDGDRKPSIGQSSRQDWFDSIKLLKDRVVLFHFNKGAGNLDEFEKKLSRLFSGTDKLSYDQVKQKYSILNEDAVKAIVNPESGESDNFTKASVGAMFDSFKREFPEAASKAEQSLRTQNLSKDDVIFFLYNEQDLNPRETKTAPFFAHDIGHIVWDIFGSDYMKVISYEIYKVLSFYISKDDLRLRSAKKDVDLRNVERLSSKIYVPYATLGSRVADEFLKKSVSGIFSGGGENVTDAAYDLVALYSNPNSNVQVSIPTEFTLPYPYEGEVFFIPEDRKEEAEKILKDSLENLKKELSEENPDKELAPEDLKKDLSKKNFMPPEMKGKVFFMELY